jgi:hypothetical protein
MEAWSPRDRQGSARAPPAVRAQGQGVPLTARAPRSAAVTGRPLGLLPSWPGRCAEGGRASFFSGETCVPAYILRAAASKSSPSMLAL